MNQVTLTRDVEAAVIPVGTKVTLQKGEQAFITSIAGRHYTVVVNEICSHRGQRCRGAGHSTGGEAVSTGGDKNPGATDKEIWNQLRGCL